MNIPATQFNDLVVIEPKHRQVVEPLLVAESLTPHIKSAVLFWAARKGEVIFRAGYLPRLRNELRRRGRDLELVDKSLWAGEPDLSSWRTVIHRDEENRFADQIAGNPRGQIYFDTSKTRAQLVALIGELFPESKICVIGKSNKSASSVARQVKPFTRRPIQCTAQDSFRVRNRFVVTNQPTFDSIVAPEWFDICIFADVEAALSIRSVKQITRLRRQRMYVLVAAGWQADAEARLVLEAFFGPTIFYAVTSERQPGAVVVEFATLPWITVPTTSSPLHRKRACLWGNDVRNRCVAEIARAFASCDMESLWQHGVLLRAPSDFLANDRCVVILVERAEHARALAQMLPGWDVATAMPGAKAPRGESWHGERAIATFVFAEEHGIRAQVVIRADGTSSAWRERWGPDPGSFHSPQRPFVVVDVRDDWDPTSLRDTCRRRTEYARRGWEGTISKTTLAAE